jgi:hypothetical protein
MTEKEIEQVEKHSIGALLLNAGLTIVRLEKQVEQLTSAQGNLLLEFSKKSDTPYIDSLADGSAFNGVMMNTDGTFTWTISDVKPSIPTDKKIEKKAHNEYPYGYTNSIGSYDRSRYETKKESYILGYKQALKDLGL